MNKKPSTTETRKKSGREKLRATVVTRKPSEGKTLTAPLYNQKGEKVGQVSLDKEIFGNKVNQTLISQAARVYLTNQRGGTASTKTRSEVARGGGKPWRQKGLGRARVGSIRIPQWRGGGVAHGPKPKAFELSLPKKMRRKAILSTLSSKAADKEIMVLKELAFKEPKTKVAAKLFSSLPLKGKSLLIIGEKDENVQKSVRNLPTVSLEPVPNLNTYVLLNNDNLIFTKTALEKMSKLYLEKR